MEHFKIFYFQIPNICTELSNSVLNYGIMKQLHVFFSSLNHIKCINKPSISLKHFPIVLVFLLYTFHFSSNNGNFVNYLKGKHIFVAIHCKDMNVHYRLNT